MAMLPVDVVPGQVMQSKSIGDVLLGHHGYV